MEDDAFTRRIIGSAFRVQNELGTGLLEAAYQAALAIDFELERIPFEREAAIPLFYRGRSLGVPYRADFLCGDVIVELKAISNLGRVEEAQVIHYLKATGRATALLVNFGSVNVQVRRLVNRPRGTSIERMDASPPSPGIPVSVGGG